MVANGVPVLARPVLTKRLSTTIKAGLVKVREVATVTLVLIKALEQRQGFLNIVQNAWITCQPVGHYRTAQRVNLLINWKRMVIVAELRSEQLMLFFSIG